LDLPLLLLRHERKQVSNIGCNYITVRVNRHDTNTRRHVWCIELSKFRFPAYGGLFRLGQRLFSDKYASVAAAHAYAPPPRTVVNSEPQPTFEWCFFLQSAIAFAIARPAVGSVATPHVPSGAIATTVMSFCQYSSVLAVGGSLSSVADHSPPEHSSEQKPRDIVAANTATLVR
jgi:hypothetical protein